MRNINSWQLILADLALILFLVTTAGLVDETDDQAAPPAPVADVPAQALYRPRADAPAIKDWVTQQNPDPRMTLTLVATHRAGHADQAWNEASTLAQQARGAGVAVRVVMREGTAPDLYASLGYDDLSGT